MELKHSQESPYITKANHSIRFFFTGSFLYSMPWSQRNGKLILLGFPWWLRGKESTCLCRGHRFDPWFGKIPHISGQLSPNATTIEPVLRAWELHLLRPMDPRACAPQEKSLQWEACTLQQRPSTVKNKQINCIKKKNKQPNSSWFRLEGDIGGKFMENWHLVWALVMSVGDGDREVQGTRGTQAHTYLGQMY